MTRNLIIYGSAPNAAADLARIPDHGSWDHMAVGMDALVWEGSCPEFIVTNHPEDIPAIRRRFVGALIVGPAPSPGVDVVAPYDPPRERSGGSAMTAVIAALRLGYTRIVLCGCPLAGNAPEGNPYEAFRPGWEDRKEELVGKIRSMSGWTRELLGAPPEEWLKGA